MKSFLIAAIGLLVVGFLATDANAERRIRIVKQSETIVIPIPFKGEVPKAEIQEAEIQEAEIQKAEIQEAEIQEAECHVHSRTRCVTRSRSVAVCPVTGCKKVVKFRCWRRGRCCGPACDIQKKVDADKAEISPVPQPNEA